jgi:hypothetical protein
VKQDRMLGSAAGDPHKNTARCKRVNDRDRRRKKRNERGDLNKAIKSGALLASILHKV